MTRPLILHHTALPHRGGATRVARLLLAAQAAAGFPVAHSFEVAENDPEVLGQEQGAAASQPTGAPADLGQRAKNLPPDSILHLHTSTDWPALLAGLAGFDSARLILTLHDASQLTGGCVGPLDCPHQHTGCQEPCPRGLAGVAQRQTERLALLRRVAPRLVSPSRWLGKLAQGLLPELSLRIVPNGVEWPPLGQLPTRQAARAALGIAPAARVALFVSHGGARTTHKGALWTEIWEGVKAAVPQALGLAVGGDAMGRERDLLTWPYLDRARLLLVMRAADALVYPTLADNHPLVLLEAAACELAAACYQTGGVPEIIRHGETGMLAPTGDAQTLTAQVAALLEQPAAAHRLGRDARASGERRFTAERMASDYLRLLSASAAS